MNVSDFVVLQQYFRDSGKKSDELVNKYEILPRPVLLTARSGIPLQTRVYRWFRDLLLRLGMIKPSKTAFAWSPRLKHVPVDEDARVVILWAVGQCDKDTLRLELAAALERFKSQAGGVGVLGVLLTNVPDFAFYSRLGWLVEYLPAESEVFGTYSQKKLRYLAWRYKHADVVPVICDTLYPLQMERVL